MNETQILAFMLILTRVSVFVGFFSLFSFRQLPTLVKTGMAVGLSVFWFGEIGTTAYHLEGTNPGMLESSLMFFQEFAIGMMLAVALNLLFIPCKIAGAYVGQEFGLSLASQSNPGTPDSSTLITRVFESFTILIFFTIDLHHFLILSIDYSFRHLTGTLNALAMPTGQLVTMLNDTSDFGLMVVGPLAVIMMIVTVCLALLNKAVPAMNLFTVGMSVRAGFGIFCLAILMPVIFGSIRGYLGRVESDIESLLMAFQYN